MSKPDDLIVFARPSSAFEAQVVAGVLESAGVPTYGPTGLLADEFAMSQALMNVGTEIRIRSADRGRAEEALAAAKQAGAELSEAGEDPEDPEGSGAS